jgi:two-component sensor histidine kinase
MDKRIAQCQQLTERDLALLYKIEEGLPITADVSRADLLLCCLKREDQVLIGCHARPNSMSSIYLQDATGRLFRADEQPLVHQALTVDRSGIQRKRILSSGAPVIQQVHPIHNAAGRVIATLLVETNMIEYERNRRRDPAFRRALSWLQQMAIRGEIEMSTKFDGFGPVDGIYLVDANAHIQYMSGIATNLFRAIGIVQDMRQKPISALEAIDEKLVSQAMQANHCLQHRQESEDDRVWIRTVIPVRAPQQSWYHMRQRWLDRLTRWKPTEEVNLPSVDGALVLVHNATEQVQRERELNVKSAMIQEVHHRVKNNLQTIAAMLRIQARRTESEEARQQLTDAVNRVLSMSVIHEYLSQDEHRPINIRDVCQRIISQARQVSVAPGRDLNIRMEGPNIRLLAGQATPAALVMNELLLNAIEHGLRDRAEGNITLLLADLGDHVELIIEDDGEGLPENFSISQSSSLGLQITHTLVTDDLKGSLRFEQITGPEEEGSPVHGVRAVVNFPKRFHS